MSSPALLLLVLVYLGSAGSFNVDTHNYVKHRGNPGSMFGFSVASHREQSNSWLIVGAPEAQTTQPGVTRGGAVYRCDIARDDTCSLIEFDMKGNINDSEGKQVDMKSFQWFGATVKSSGEDGIVMACAPRYIWFSSHYNRRDPVGTCYVAKNLFTEFSEYSPCRTRNWGYHRQGSCQAGLGASISKDGMRLYVGAVGSWYWQGQLHSIDAFARLLFVPPRYTIIEEGQVISQSAHARPDVISTREGPSTDDDSYLGYSVAAGNFSGSEGVYGDVAVGMPRGAGLLGKVVLYSWNMTNLNNITGEQLGAYFGYSLASCDLDGDGRDDIIVGAPLYTDLTNNKGHYETGRVYIIYQGTRDYAWKDIHVRDGVNSRSRFGLSLASLGDINLDGYQDFAVGAPYDGPKERGAVYIFHGSKRGAREKASQVIYSEQIAGQPSTFGFSLAGGLDLDENLYPDLIVGAYDSDTAVFLRSRPVVKVEASMSFLLASKQISLEEKNCTLKDRTKVPCVELNTCLKFSGTGVDRRLEFEIQIVLDTKKPRSPRMFFISDENRNQINQTVRLDKNNQSCKNTVVYIKPTIRDKLTSLEAEMRYGLKGSEMSPTRRVARLLTPVLDDTEELHKKDVILIQKNCGKDNICIPNLRLIATPSVNSYLLGSGERLEIDVIVQNEGEDAFEAIYQLQVPTGLNYVKIERVEPVSKDLPVLCSPPSYLNNNTLHCDIGNPLPKEKIVHFKVLLQPYRQEGLKPRYEFYMSVNSTNPENDSSMSDNQVHFKVPIWVETDLILQGSSQPSDVHYNMTQYQISENVTQESQIGPQVNHIYSIRNKGPSDIIEAEAYFLWPSYTLAGDHLFYLLEQPEVTGNAHCEIVEEVDVERLNMEKRRKSQYDSSFESAVHSSFTGSDGASASSSSSSSSSHRWSGSSSSSSSSSSGSSSGGSGSQGSFSLEERKRMEEAQRRKEEETGEVGDASEKHKERWRQTHRTSNGGSLESDAHLGGSRQGGSWRNQTSWSNSSSGGRGGITEGGRVETTRTEQRGTWSGSREGGSVSESGRIDHDMGRGSINSGGRVDLGKDIIIDTRGSVTGGGSWSGGDLLDVSGTRIPINEDRRVWHYNETRTGQRGTSRNPIDLGGTRAGHSETGTDSRESSRVDTSWSRGSNTGVTDIRKPNSTYFEERNYERNASWNDRDQKPRVSTSWSVNKDGVVSRGSHEENSGSAAENKDESYFGHRDKGWNETWMHSENNRNRGSGGGYSNAYDESRGYIRPAGGKNYSEERTITRNTTWGSRDGPVTIDHSSWSTNSDGTVRNGSQSRVYHEKDDYGRDKIGSSQGVSRDNLDPNLIRGGSRTYSENREVHRNTSWSSGEGGKPVTLESRHWSIEKDGVVTNGSSSNKYDSSFNAERASSGETNRDGSLRYGNTRLTTDSRTYSEGSGSSNDDKLSHEQTAGVSSTDDSRRVQTSSGSWKSGGSDNQRDNIENRGSTEEERRGQASQSSSRGEERRRTSVEGSSSGRIPTNTNIGDILNSRRANEGLSGLGAVALGPSDGVARTYSLDLGVLNSANKNSENSDRTGGGYRSETGSDSRDYGERDRHSGSSGRTEERRSGSEGYSSGSRHYEFGSSSGSRDSDHNSGSARTESRHSSSRTGGFSTGQSGNAESEGGSNSHEGGYRSSGGNSRSWSYSSTSGTADGDSTGHGGIYSRREQSSHSQSSHYGPRNRRQVDEVQDFDSSLVCETTKCTRIRCTVGPLKKDEEAIIKFKSRVWVHTLKKLTGWNKVNVSSMLVARVSRLPHIGKPDVVSTRTHEVLTQLIPRHPPPKPEVVPLWIIVLSACAGAILLMLLVFILYKVGFFKRNRPSNSPEKQPLNRNGHYQPGDEAL